MIYFIGHFFDEALLAVKIGHSRVIEKRLRGLQTGTPGELRILCRLEGERERERELHEQFRGCCMSGEWFRPTEELQAFIKEHEGDTWGRTVKRGTRITVDLQPAEYARLVDLAHSMGKPKAHVMRRLLWFYQQIRDVREEVRSAEGVELKAVTLGFVANGNAHLLEVPEDEFGHPDEWNESELWEITEETYSDTVESGEFLDWENESLGHQLEEIARSTGLRGRGEIIKFAVRYLRFLLAQQKDGDELAWVKSKKARRVWLPKPGDIRVMEDGPTGPVVTQDKADWMFLEKGRFVKVWKGGSRDVLHLRDKETRKCENCGIRLLLSTDGAWTEDAAEWEKSRRCKRLPRGFGAH